MTLSNNSVKMLSMKEWKPGEMVVTAYGYGKVYLYLKSHGLYRIQFFEDGANVYRDLLYKDLREVNP